MTEAQVKLLEKEDWYREEYAKKRFLFEGEIHTNPFAASELVFDNLEKYQYLPEDEDEAAVPKVFTACRDTTRRGPCVVPSMEVFLERWNEFTEGMFAGMDWSNVVVAGGAVLACLAEPRNDQQYAGSDIDIFVHGVYTDEEANAKLRHIHQTVMKNCRSRGDIVRTKRACTILNQYPYRHVQVILRLYKNPGEVLLGFDIDCCAVGFNGSQVFAEERFRRAITKRYNLVNRSRRSTTYEVRLFKYGKRGFCAAVPDLDKARVDPRVFEQHINEATNLRKLLLFEHSMLHPKSPFVASRFTNNTLGVQRENKRKQALAQEQLQRGRMAEIELLSAQHPSDYSDIHLPWGPEWYTNQILRAMRERERRHLRQFRRTRSQREAAGIDRPSKRRWRHRHRYVYGIDGAISGTSPWCIICKQGLVGPLPDVQPPPEPKKTTETTTERTAVTERGTEKESASMAESGTENGNGKEAERVSGDERGTEKGVERKAEGKVTAVPFLTGPGGETVITVASREKAKEREGAGRVDEEAAVGVLGPTQISVTDTDTKKKRTIVFEAEDTTMTGPLVWLKNVPAYQDYDNGFVRHLLTSSFEPVNTNFEEGVYLEDPADMTEGHQSLVKYLLGTPAPAHVLQQLGHGQGQGEGGGGTTPMLEAREVHEKEFQCADCEEEFASLNQLRRHIRQGCSPASCSGATVAAPLQQRTGELPKAPQRPLGFLTLMRPEEEEPFDEGRPLLEEEEEEEEEEEGQAPAYPPMRDEVDVIVVPTWARPLPAPGDPNPFAAPRPRGPSSSHESDSTTPTDTEGNGEEEEMARLPPPMPRALPGRTELLLLLARLWKMGALAIEQRAVLKQLAFREDEALLGAVLAFEANADAQDLVETLGILATLHATDGDEREAEVDVAVEEGLVDTFVPEATDCAREEWEDQYFDEHLGSSVEAEGVASEEEEDDDEGGGGDQLACSGEEEQKEEEAWEDVDGPTDTRELESDQLDEADIELPLDDDGLLWQESGPVDDDEEDTFDFVIYE